MVLTRRMNGKNCIGKMSSLMLENDESEDSQKSPWSKLVDGHKGDDLTWTTRSQVQLESINVRHPQKRKNQIDVTTPSITVAKHNKEVNRSTLIPPNFSITEQRASGEFSRSLIPFFKHDITAKEGIKEVSHSMLAHINHNKESTNIGNGQPII